MSSCTAHPDRIRRRHVGSAPRILPAPLGGIRHIARRRARARRLPGAREALFALRSSLDALAGRWRSRPQARRS